mmetsp:Transcript_65775/g.214066  ORF Transcript_65775/g.214066 Transcript_65775/m.214066 type:complete len:438 (+) Transcript_65775:72-1385(+)
MARMNNRLLPIALVAAALVVCIPNLCFQGVAPNVASAGAFAGSIQATDLARLASSTRFAPDSAGSLAAFGAAPEPLPRPQGIGERVQQSAPGLSALLGLALGARAGGLKGFLNKITRHARGGAEEESGLKAFSTGFCNLFAVWLAIAAVAAVKYPPSFLWVESSYFTGLLGLLMFSVGITTTIDDFKDCLKRPGAVAINFFACYAIMPVLALLIAKAIGAEGPILAGLLLVGSINGGQASNLCTLIAGGDVALSVLMTTSTTLGCIFMTPSICKLVLGAVVPVDAMGIVYSTIQVVLAPIFVGVALNTLAPKLCRAVAPFTPIVGVISTVLLVGASVASCAQPILTAGLPLQLACLTLHLLGGILGYFATRAGGNDERTCRTVAIETAMKSSAFGYLLASLHFGAFDVRVPAAVSVVWMAITGSIMAVYWKGKPLTA